MFTESASHFLITGLVTLIIGYTISSCSDRTINPFEENQGVFSVYGALKVGESPNYIRVRDLLQPFNSDTTEDLGATVTFTDLSTGESTVLRDTSVVFSGNITYNYILEEDLKLDNQYRITVEGSDGRSVSSIATTPRQTIADHQPDDEFVFCETTLDFTFDNVEPPEFVQMEIGVEYNGQYHWAPMEIVGDIEYDPVTEKMVVEMSPRNLLVEVFPPIIPDNPYFNPYLLFPTVGCDDLDSNIIQIRYTHFGPEWGTGRPQENSPIDIESGLIENGLGFFGAYRTDTLMVQFFDEPEEDE